MDSVINLFTVFEGPACQEFVSENTIEQKCGKRTLKKHILGTRVLLVSSRRAEHRIKEDTTLPWHVNKNINQHGLYGVRIINLSFYIYIYIICFLNLNFFKNIKFNIFYIFIDDFDILISKTEKKIILIKFHSNIFLIENH